MNKIGNTKIKSIDLAASALYIALVDVLNAWTNCDDNNIHEKAIIEKCEEFYPFHASLEDIVSKVYAWCEEIQKAYSSIDTLNNSEQFSSMKLHDFLDAVNRHQSNRSGINLNNEICLVFDGLRGGNENIDEQIVCRWRCDNAHEWFHAYLSCDDQKKVLEYYSKILKIKIDTSNLYTKKELVQYVYDMGGYDGGSIEVSGHLGNEEETIVIDQNEWYDTPVCFIGGYGKPVKAIRQDKVLLELPDILDEYLPHNMTYTIKTCGN